MRVECRDQEIAPTEERVRNPGNLTGKSLGFTRYLETVSCPGQAVFFDGQSF